MNKPTSSNLAALRIVIAEHIQLWEVPARILATPDGMAVLADFLATQPDEWISIAEACDMLRTTVQNLQGMIFRGHVRSLPNPRPTGRRQNVRLVSRTDILAQLQRRCAAAAAPKPGPERGA
jgi:hypothetical protein